ncbi:MAG: M28 family peptidase [Bacteroidetes bacterium]|nr:M28 family peptidase [Bacteroidota bacterium]
MKKTKSLILLLLVSIATINAQNPLVQSLLNDVQLDSLTNFVKQLSGENAVIINGVTDTIKSRQYQQPGNEKAFQFMKQEFIRYGYQIDSFAFNTDGKNLFAIKTGYKYPNRRFMLGAHYDNWPLTTIAPGADDNASGSATVLEAGRVFANYSFPYTIVFALWDEEEVGLLGSIAYVPTIGSNNDTLMGYVNADMLGWDSNNDSVADINVRQVANSVTLLNKAQFCNSAYNIQLGLHIVDPGNGSTDHAPFWNNGYSAIGIDEEYDNDFNPFWHTTSDSLVKFNLSFYQKCSKLAYATIAEFALDTLNTVGIKENTLASQFQLFPNPFTKQITIRSERPDLLISAVVISDCTGRIVYESQINHQAPTLLISENLERGIYFIEVFTSEKSFVKKIIKQ